MDVQSSHRINIAIDGPAGAGKSTVARLVANALQYIYVDTGAMYRAVTMIALERGLSSDNEREIGRLANELEIELLPGEGGQRVLVDGADVTGRLRTLDVNRNVSAIAAIEAVRKRMADLQRKMAAAKGVVMDGRDIGTHVLPDAELKVFLTASPRERAERRFRELGDNPGITLDQLELDIAERDRKDQEREFAPLVQAPDARFVDSTGWSIDQVAEQIVEWGRAAARTISAGEK
ncbi:(d)CMP kinase [Cohnella sp. AR92]|uniref:(d)CMP kinase n=1 Tax=Cohnella sp. AR92 TaxID=648716 RepID=UPI000F8D3484|nr:(d)CMP kinase [Cohnella sp. AR92]RUS48151.1 (d)CMP kinase [Cohnella sp. AR92]